MKLFPVPAHALLFQLCAVTMLFSTTTALFSTTTAEELSVEEYVSSVRDWEPQSDEGVLPIGLTPEEEEILQQRAATGSSGSTRTRTRTNKYPTSRWQARKPVLLPEWNPMQGVLIAYPLGLSYDLIAALHQRATIFCLVAPFLQTAAKRAFENNGIDPDEVEWIVGGVDSYWTRDYGPWFVSTTRSPKGIAVINHEYNRPRPNDDEAPSKVAEALDVPYFDSGIVGCGGNMMVDGTGQAVATHIAYTENPECGTNDDSSVPLDGCRKVDKVMERYYGVDTFHVVADPSNVYIDHVDCWAKYLSPTQIMIREVSTSHPQYDEIEEVVTYFSGTQTAEGDDWDIVRVWTDSDQPYTNSLILNGEVFVPIVGSIYDDDALETYRNAMPDYVVSAWEGSWQSTDALHCRTRGIPEFQ